MGINDVKEFTQAWSAAYDVQNKTISDIAVEMAFEALANHDLADVKRAIMTHIKTSKFPPKPADINEIIDGDPDSRKLQAWTLVEQTIKRVGGYESVVFPDPAIMAVIDDMGGWIKLCDITEKELPFMRNEFVKRYSPFLHKPPSKYPRRLAGKVEQTNQGDYPGRLVGLKLIGDKQAVKMVFEGGQNSRLNVAALDRVADSLPKLGVAK